MELDRHADSGQGAAPKIFAGVNGTIEMDGSLTGMGGEFGLAVKDETRADATMLFVAGDDLAAKGALFDIDAWDADGVSLTGGTIL